MIKDQTIDQALIELARTMAALKALRKARRDAEKENHADVGGRAPKGSTPWFYHQQCREHAAALRSSLDLTRKLADLRLGR